MPEVTNEWAAVDAALEEKAQVSPKARSLFARLRAQTIPIVIAGEEFPVRRPSKEALAEMGERLQAMATAVAAQDQAKELQRLKAALCHEVAALFLPDTLTEADLLASEYGLDVAAAVFEQLAAAMADEKATAATFRGKR